MAHIIILIVYMRQCEKRNNTFLCWFTAKNIVLAGVKVCYFLNSVDYDFKNVMIPRGLMMGVCVFIHLQTVTLHDTKQCEVWDLGINFFIHQDDVFNQRKR